MAQNLGTVIVLGDSFVRRMQRYLRGRNIRNMNLAGYQVDFLGLPGGTVSSRKPIIHLVNRAIRARDLAVVYLHIGSNDLSTRTTDPTHLAQRVHSLAKFILASSDTVRVVIGQIHRRLKVPDRLYNTRVKDTNIALQNLCEVGHSRILFRRISRLLEPQVTDFCDGIHFTDTANNKFYRGIRGAIMKALHVGDVQS